MGEIDTKPIESVQVALSFFGEKSDQKKHRPTSSELDTENDKDIEALLKDLANYKLQLEAKDSSYMQVLLKVEHYRKTVDELSTLLKNSEAERDKCIEEYRVARIHIDELESKTKEMANPLAETAKVREQLSHALNELKVVQGELLSMETELAVARDLQLKAMTQAELMETSANMDREKVENLLEHLSELNETILMSKLAAIDAEKEKYSILLEKDAEIEFLTAAAVQAQEQLEDMRNRLEMMQELENQILEKSTFIDTVQSEFKQVNELFSSSEKAASDAINDLNHLKAELEIKERKNSDQAFCIEALETEMNQLKLELKNASEEVDRMQSYVDVLISELEKTKTEMDEVTRRETEAQVEIALLKSELHKGRSKIAAAEAAEARSQSVKSGLYLAVQQLAVEAEEAKKENQRLKGADKVAEESEISVLVSPQDENSSKDVVLSTDDSKVEAEEKRDHSGDIITVTLEAYESLVRKVEKADRVPDSAAENSNQLAIVPENKYEVEILKKELEVAMVKIGEFRTRAEQAVTRAESAEKAKAALEDQLRKWRVQKQKRKAALAALREESVPKEYDPPTYKEAPTKYQPLGKVLNMKF